MRPQMEGNPPKFKRGEADDEGSTRGISWWPPIPPSASISGAGGERSPLFPTVAEGPPGPGPSFRRRGLRDHRLGGREEGGAQASPFPAGFTLGPRAHAGGGNPDPSSLFLVSPPSRKASVAMRDGVEARTAVRGDDVLALVAPGAPRFSRLEVVRVVKGSFRFQGRKGRC